MYTLYVICASVNKKYHCSLVPGLHVNLVISVDFIQYYNIKLISAKCLESAVFWHMNDEANTNMDTSQQIYTFSS